MNLRTATIAAVAALAAACTSPASAQEYGDRHGTAYTGVSHESKLRENEMLRERVADLESRLDAALEGSYDGGCGCGESSCCGCQCADWYDPCCGPTMIWYLAGDAWRNKAESDRNNNFGGHLGVDANWALNSSGVRGQLGASYGAYDYHGRYAAHQDARQQAVERQIFLTAGVYKRASNPCCDPWSWGAAYDYLHDTGYGLGGASSADLHQVRFIFGRLVDPCNEIGVWGAFGVGDDQVYLETPAFAPLQTVRPMDQVNLYWRRYWDCGGETMLYAGVGEEQPDNPGFPYSPPSAAPGGDDFSEVVVGLRGIMPLNCNVGLFGNFHYVIPSTTGGGIAPNGVFHSFAEEIWNVSFGVMFVRGCNLPLLPVADNGLFSVQAPPGFFLD